VKMRNNKIRLVKNLLALAVIGLCIFAVYDYFWRDDSSDFAIENTPLKVEMVRSIAEISTISYKDEVVEDTIVYYKSTSEQVSGNILKMGDLDYWKYGIRSSNIDKRLTLIVKGEVRYGFDLSKHPIDIQHNKDTIWLNIPKPRILDVIVVPSATEIFQENGDWNDKARVTLEKKAIAQLKANAEKLNLLKKTTSQMEKLLRSIVPKDRVLLIYFND